MNTSASLGIETSSDKVVEIHPARAVTSYGQIWVKFQREGIHKYPAAGTDPALKEVSFLQYDHRHIFHFKVWIDVYHNDRDVEFILFKRWLESLYDGTLQLDYKSCEMLADELADHISAKFPGRNITISVSEDDENGCQKWYNQVP